LRGTVDTAEHKQEAERIARGTDGVKRVNNQLRISKAEILSTVSAGRLREGHSGEWH